MMTNQERGHTRANMYKLLSSLKRVLLLQLALRDKWAPLQLSSSPRNLAGAALA